jgi:hypothetical protein
MRVFQENFALYPRSIGMIFRARGIDKPGRK